MAERRMLAKTIIESDAFSSMPLEAQMLYVRLNMAADDDGFVSNPRTIMRGCGATEDSMKLLVAKKFVLLFEVGDSFIFLIKHWRIHNYIQRDRYKASTFKNLLREVYLDENKAYSVTPGADKKPALVSKMDTPCIQDVSNTDTECIQDVSKMDTQVRLGKYRVVEGSKVQDNLNTLSGKLGEKGESEGGKQPAPPPSLNESARVKRIEELRETYKRFKRLGFDPRSVFALAASSGIRPEEIVPEEGKTDGL